MTDKQFYKDFLIAFNSLKKEINQHTKNLFGIVKNTIERPEISKQFWNEAEIAINNEFNAMRKLLNDWLRREIPKQYQAQFSALAKEVAETEKILIDITAIFRSYERQEAASQILNRIRLEALKDFTIALQNGNSNLTRLFRLTKQKVIDEYSLNSALWKAYQSGDIRNFASILATENSTFSSLYNTIVTEGKFIEAGGRHFTPEYYAELVARTRWHEAQSLATIDLCKVVGTDLVKVSDHNTTTELCMEHEGQIYSISGENKEFPLLEETPPFHPNCLHTLHPYFESALEVEREAIGGK